MVERKSHLTFILSLPELSEDGDFYLKDLPGSGKRIDILCRSLAACFDWGPSTLDKSSLEIIALVGENSCLRFNSPNTSKAKGEVWWAKAIRDGLRGNPPQFISVENLDLEGVIQETLSNERNSLWVLDEAGMPISNGNLSSDAQNSFIIGGHRGFDSETLKVFDDHSIYRLSLGTTSYLASHCIATLIAMYEEMIHDVR